VPSFGGAIRGRYTTGVTDSGVGDTMVPIRRESEETNRLLALSDGVIAIVITLLVLDISVPTVPPGSSTTELLELVLAQWPEFLGFVLSFLVIGFYWILHRRAFVYIETHERGVVYLNLVFLILVAFVPYATSMFTTYPGQFGVSFLSAALAITGLALAGLWIYASRRDLMEEGLTSRSVQIQAARFLATPAVFLLAVVVALVDARLAILTWLLLIPINGALQSRLVENAEQSSPKPEPRVRESN
jgi:uncharacterized membrane protein